MYSVHGGLLRGESIEEGMALVKVPRKKARVFGARHRLRVVMKIYIGDWGGTSLVC